MDRHAKLQLLVRPGIYQPGDSVPIVVEGSIDPKSFDGGADGLCVSLWGTPGHITLPFGSECAGNSSAKEGGTSADAAAPSGSDASPGDASSDSGSDASLGDASSDASGSDASGADASGNSSASDASAGDASSAATTLQAVTHCLQPQQLSNGWRGGNSIVVYVPHGTERSATVAGALFANPTCSGSSVAEVATVVGFGQSATADAGADAGNDASDSGAADAAADGSPDAGAQDAGAQDAGGDAATDGPPPDGSNQITDAGDASPSDAAGAEGGG